MADVFIQADVPEAELVGSGRFSVLFWDIYDASLFAPGGHWRSDAPFALSLTYLRDFEGKEIAIQSVKEMRRQDGITNEQLDKWGESMTALFPDVTEGDTLTGVYLANGNARFFLNGKQIGDITAEGFATHFFAIWLGEKASEPSFRDKLLVGARK